MIALEPITPIYGEHYRSGEMRVAYTRGNINLKWQNRNIHGGRLFGGVVVNENFDLRHQFMRDTTLPDIDHFGNAFHTYSLTWLPEEIILSVDGNEYGRIPTNFKEQIIEPIWKKGERNAPLDQMVSENKKKKNFSVMRMGIINLLCCFGRCKRILMPARGSRIICEG